MKNASSGTGDTNWFRWATFIPAALICSVTIRFISSLLIGVIFGITPAAYPDPQAVSLSVGIFLGAAVFVLTGAFIAPGRRPKTAFVLFWLSVVFFLLVELFRAPMAREPVPHLVLIGLNTAGAFLGCLTAVKSIKSRL